jgi:hypothetical protein
VIVPNPCCQGARKHRSLQIVANSAVIFSEGNVEHPVQAVFDGAGEWLWFNISGDLS